MVEKVQIFQFSIQLSPPLAYLYQFLTHHLSSKLTKNEVGQRIRKLWRTSDFFLLDSAKDLPRSAPDLPS